MLVVYFPKTSRVIGIDAQVGKQEGLATGFVAGAVRLDSDENGVDLCQDLRVVESQRVQNDLRCCIDLNSLVALQPSGHSIQGAFFDFRRLPAPVLAT
jgi:hypothetical protein